MTLAQLRAWAAANKAKLLAAGGVGVAGVALIAQRRSGKGGSPGGGGGGAPTPFAPAGGSGGYDSTSSDVYNRLQGQYEQLSGQVSASNSASSGVYDRLQGQFEQLSGQIADLGSARGAAGGPGWEPAPAASAPQAAYPVEPAPVPAGQPSSPVMPELPTSPDPAPAAAVPAAAAVTPWLRVRSAITRKPATAKPPWARAPAARSRTTLPRIGGLLKLTPSRLQRGGDVATLQRQLIARGYKPGKVDGIFGRRTDAAVRAFQARSKLAVDGDVGPKTAAKLGLGYGRRPPPVTHAPARVAPKPAPKPARPRAQPAPKPAPKRAAPKRPALKRPAPARRR